MKKFLGVGETARELKVDPFSVSMLLYRDPELAELCPVVSGRRLIPGEMIRVIELKLKRRVRRAHRNSAGD